MFDTLNTSRLEFNEIAKQSKALIQAALIEHAQNTSVTYREKKKKKTFNSTKLVGTILFKNT